MARSSCFIFFLNLKHDNMKYGKNSHFSPVLSPTQFLSFAKRRGNNYESFFPTLLIF